MRILAVFSLALSAAVFAANYALPAAALLPLALTFALMGAALLLFRRKWLRGAELALFGLAAGFGVFLVKYNAVTLPCRALDGQKMTVHAYLRDYPDDCGSYYRAEVRLTDKDIPSVNAILYVNDLSLSGGRPGQIIEADVRLHSADVRYGKEYDRYNARDIFLTASAGTVSFTGESRSGVTIAAAKIRAAALKQIDEFYGGREGAFLKALLLGDKSALYEDTELYNALADAGIMHAAAVSGMHVAFLAGLLVILFGAGRCAAIASIALVWAFVLITGASPSAVRAGFMQSLLLLAPVFRRENDPVTSLSAVLAMVLIKNPYAACSLSLQLSFGAMAGILCFGGKIYTAMIGNTDGLAGRILKYPAGIVSASLAVTVLTLPLTAIYFGYVPLLAPLTNVLTMWALSFCFCTGFTGVLLSFVFAPFGRLAALAVSLAEKYIFAVVGFVSDIPFAVVYLTDKVMTVWMIASFIILTVYLLSRLTPRMKLLASLVSVTALLFALHAVTALSYSADKCSFAAVDVGQGQSIAVISGESCVVIDCGGGGKSSGAGQITAAHLLSRGRRRIDALVLTHLHSDHVNGAVTLMAKTDVKRLILPRDTACEGDAFSEITEAAQRGGTELVFIDEDTEMKFGGIDLTLYAPRDKGGANESCLMCRVGAFGKDMLVTADAPISAENALVDTADLGGIEYIIAGHHGSRRSSGGRLLEAAGGETAIISVGYNSYGHPTNETLARLAAYGYNIFRTDLNGTVEIRIR